MNFLISRFSVPVIIGFLIWVGQIVISIPYSTFDLTHVELLLVAAPLWLIPLIYKFEKHSIRNLWFSMIAGVLFSFAFIIPASPLHFIFIIPWLLFNVHLLYKMLSSYTLGYHDTLKVTGHVYLIVGILWVIADRLSIRPMGFDPLIVLLTGVHFHYAGFILLFSTRQLIKEWPSSWNGLITSMIILGIPLVAIGITSTELSWPPIIEVIAVTIMTISGAIVGSSYIYHSIKSIRKNKLSASPVLFIFGGLSLTVGMVLAFCYGWRHVFIIEQITIPWMYALHGTCNAVGFAIPIIVGWVVAKG